ncbi:MAG: NifU family protein [Lentisphaeria bacterium]|nr:NifU family protein [Victivallales bacterium]MBR6058435.1 NifU family protein [Victivallales bacterium]MCR4574123.1 NifU family protein [Lentisphaeria bacterium]
MNEETTKKVIETLEQLRIHLQNDGGDLELVKIEGWNVYLKLKGACGCCPHAQMTLKSGIEAILREQIDEQITVERAS